MAYKVFTNGSPLPASDLNTYLMNQSVMVFADSTARSAALTSPTEGMTTYLEDTNKVEVWTGAAWTDINDNSAAIPKSTVTTVGDLIVADGNASVTRLGIGSNGQVLSSNGTTATWTTPSSGGMTLISSTTLSGSSITWSSVPQTYLDLRIYLRNVNLSDDNKQVRMEISSSTRDYAALSNATDGANLSNYDYQWIFVTPDMDNTIVENITVIDIPDYTVTGSRKVVRGLSIVNNATTTANYNYRNAITVSKQAFAVDQIKLFTSSGSFDGGTALLYGVK